MLESRKAVMRVFMALHLPDLSLSGRICILRLYFRDHLFKRNFPDYS